MEQLNNDGEDDGPAEVRWGQEGRRILGQDSIGHTGRQRNNGSPRV